MADPRRHARRGQLWTRRAGLGLASSLAEWLRADPATNADLRACLEPVTIGVRSQPVGCAHADAVSQRHVVSPAAGPPNASSDREPNPASHAPADDPPYNPANAPAYAYPDRTPAGREQADPARLADDHPHRAHV